MLALAHFLAVFYVSFAMAAVQYSAFTPKWGTDASTAHTPGPAASTALQHKALPSPNLGSAIKHIFVHETAHMPDSVSAAPIDTASQLDTLLPERNS